MKRPKIKAISVKYGFSLTSKKEVEAALNMLSNQKSDSYMKIEKEVVEGYYKQRLPVEIARDYLNLSQKCKLTDTEIIVIACIRHQKSLLEANTFKRKIKHIIDGMEYPCEIVYNSPKCKCGINGYVWSLPKQVKYPRNYWLWNDWRPMIYLKRQPHLSMLEEYDIIQNYIQRCKIKINENKKLINHRSTWKRVNAYPFYYKKYWEWEHHEDESLPQTAEQWRKYIASSGCANHRDLVETVHIKFAQRKASNIDYRYMRFI